MERVFLTRENHLFTQIDHFSQIVEFVTKKY